MPSEDKSVKLWDVATGQYLATFDWPKAAKAFFSPDSKTLAAVSADNKLKLWFADNEGDSSGQRK